MLTDSLDKFEYRGEGSLRAWMGRIVVNQALTALRSAKRLTVLHIDGFSEKDLGPEEEPQPEGIPAEALQNMIAALPDGYRTVFNLYIFEQSNPSNKYILTCKGFGCSFAPVTLNISRQANKPQL